MMSLREARRVSVPVRAIPVFVRRPAADQEEAGPPNVHTPTEHFESLHIHQLKNKDRGYGNEGLLRSGRCQRSQTIDRKRLDRRRRPRER